MRTLEEIAYVAVDGVVNQVKFLPSALDGRLLPYYSSGFDAGKLVAVSEELIFTSRKDAAFFAIGQCHRQIAIYSKLLDDIFCGLLANG